jgi:hypothetical protein
MNHARVTLLGLLAVCALAGAAIAGEGFGMLAKDFAYLQRTHPPKVFLRGTKVAVRATAQTQQLQGAADRLRSLLESEILSADSRLAVDDARPETLIEVTVVESRGEEKWETRTVLKSRKTGEDAKGKAIYTQYEDHVRYKIVTYSFSVAYKVQDSRSRSSLDADTIKRTYEQDFAEGNGAPELSSLESGMVGQVVEVIKLRITPSREQIGVLVPRGSLKDLANLAEAGLWNQYLEAVEAQPPKPKPVDEAYRQYAIGVAYEALGYATENSVDDTLKYLQQASVYYSQALQMNPGEKYFSLPYQRSSFNPAAFLGRQTERAAPQVYPAPLDRVKSALIDYQRIKEFASGPERTAGAKSALGVGGSAAAGGTASLDNAGVIEMVKAGLPEEVILTAIDDSEAPAFDVSPKGLIELSKAKVSKKVIQRIQARANG